MNQDTKPTQSTEDIQRQIASLKQEQKNFSLETDRGFILDKQIKDLEEQLGQNK